MNSFDSIALSDLHAPFHDERIFKQALKFVEMTQPKMIHLVGDVVDFYTLSRFDKNPMRKLELQDELDTTTSLLTRLREIAPKARIIYTEGNHEARLLKYLSSQARDLASLRSLQIGKLLGLDELKIEWRPWNEPYRIGNLLFTHGSVIRKWSGYTARGHFEKYGCCVLHGHSHRLGSFYHTNTAGVFGAWENGCLCQIPQEYTAFPDWQPGWSLIHHWKEWFHVEQVPVIGGQYCYRGKLYGRRSAVRNEVEVLV